MTTDALDDIRVITVRPPWSFAIAHLGKPVENRTRSTSYRGPVAIHAGRTFDRHAVDDATLLQAAGAHGGIAALGILAGEPRLMRHGLVVALAELVDCHPDDGSCCSPWGQRSHSTPAAGPVVVHHLVLDHVDPVTDDIPARGQLGLPWRPDAALRAALHATPQAERRRQRLVAATSARPTRAVDSADDPDAAPDDAPSCRDCSCPMHVHNAPEFGGGCEVCGIECDGWR